MLQQAIANSLELDNLSKKIEVMRKNQMENIEMKNYCER